MSSMLRTLIWINLVRRFVCRWPASTSTLPTPDYGFAAGSYNRSVILIGGFVRPTGLTKFRIDSLSFTEEDISSSPITVDIKGLNQYYTQRQATVYMVSEYDTGVVSSFNLQTRVFTPSFVALQDVGPLVCVASTKNHLFVLGGRSDSTTSVDTFQILAFSSSQWLLNPPSLTTPRAGPTCVVHDDGLWALGGFHKGFLTTTERIPTANPDQNTWTESNTSLTDSTFYSRALSHKQFIYIIGGSSTLFVDRVVVIDMSVAPGAVSEVSLPYKVDSVGAIYSEGFIYGFGGRSKVTPPETIDTFLYFDTSTKDPTAAPSKYPTKYPSNYPSETPTRRPTKVPSKTPTPSPSKAPTNDTLAPSYAPTRYRTTVFFTEGPGPQAATPNPKQVEQMNLLIGLIVVAGVMIVVLIVVGFMWKKKRDERFAQEVQVQDMVLGELEEERQKQIDYLEQLEAVKSQQNELGCSEADVLRQVMALSAYEAADAVRRQSLQAADVTHSPRVKTTDPVKSLGSVNEDDEQTEDPKEDTKEVKAKEKEKDKDELLEDKKGKAAVVAADDDDSDHDDQKADVALEMIAMATVDTADGDKAKTTDDAAIPPPADADDAAIPPPAEVEVVVKDEAEKKEDDKEDAVADEADTDADKEKS